MARGQRNHEVRSRLWTAAIVVTITLAAVTSPVFAQDVSQADVSIGYLNVNQTMHGVNMQVTLPITEHWHFVGEINRASGCGLLRLRAEVYGYLDSGWVSIRLAPYSKDLAFLADHGRRSPFEGRRLLRQLLL